MFIKQLPLRSTNPRTPDQKPYLSDTPEKNRFLHDLLTVTQANSYNDKIIPNRHLPTGLEMHRGKVFMTHDDYKKNLNAPEIIKARRLAHAHELLFDLAYLPFIGFPLTILKDYQGKPLYS